MRRFAPTSLVFSALLFAASALISVPAHGVDPPAKPAPDTIIFKNGDQLTGKLIRADGPAVTFHSDVAGDIKINWDKIKELRTPQQYAVFKTGQKVNKKTPSADIAQGTISVSEDAIQLQGADGQRSQPIPTKSVVLLIDEASFNKELHFKPNFFRGWDGAVSGGVSTVQATQNSQAFNIAIALARVVPAVDWLAPRDRTTVNFTDSYGHVKQSNTAPAGQPSNAQDTKTSIYHADAERDEYLSTRFYALGDVAFDHNFSQGLDLQQVYGGGFGMTILKQPKQQLNAKVDIHYEKQSFSSSAGTTGGNLIGGGFGENYLRKLPKGFALTESGLLDVSFNNTSAYSSNVSGALVFPIYRRLSFNVGAVDGYLNNPPAGFNKNSFQFTTNVSYSF